MPFALLLMLGPIFGFSPVLIDWKNLPSWDAIDRVLDPINPIETDDGSTPGEKIAEELLEDPAPAETPEGDADPAYEEPQETPQPVMEEPTPEGSDSASPPEELADFGDPESDVSSGGEGAPNLDFYDPDLEREANDGAAEEPGPYDGPERLEPTEVTDEETVDIAGGRVNTLEVQSDDPISSIRIVELPEEGHASVNPDNTIALVMSGSDYTGPLTLTYEITFTDGSTETQTLDMNVAAPTQAAGWGMGKHYMVEETSEGDLFVEHGEDHRKVYVTEGAHGLTKEDIAEIEDIDVSLINNKWLEANPQYGGSPELALSTDLGMALWKHVTPSEGSSNWLLFERGYEYDLTLDLGKLSGESALHPLHYTSWGEGERPVILGETKIIHTASNLILSDLDVPGGFRAVTNSENVILHNVKSDGKEMVVDGIDRFTLHESEVLHVVTEAPKDPDQGWNGHGDRTSGLYAANSDGILIEESIFHHNAWVVTYLDGDGQPPSQYSHNVYFQWSTTDVTFRDSISSEGASFGAQFRGGAYIEDNVFLDNNAAFNILGGNYSDRGPVGNYSFVADNLVTSGAHKEADQIGALTMGIDDVAYDTGYVDNLVVHMANPDDPDEIAAKEIGHDPLDNEHAAYDNTIVFNWVGTRDAEDFDLENQNIEGLSQEELYEVTIQRFAQDVLGDPDATITDMMEYILSLPEDDFTEELTAQDIIDYFQAGFSVEQSSDEATEHRFVPNDISGGIRWDNRINWDSEDVPDDGDNVDLGGNSVQFGGTVTVGDLSLGENGQLDVNYGKLTVSGDLSVGEAGAAIDIEGAGQLWTSSYWDTDHLDIDIEDGRFANTGTFEGTTTITVMDGQALLAAGNAEMILGEGSALTIEGTEGKVGFDGKTGEAATLTLEEGATLTFEADETGLGAIEEFFSGAYGSDEDVTSEVNLGGNLVIDLTGLAHGAGDSHNLIMADQLGGEFDDVDIVGLGAGLDATVIYDYEEDALMLEIAEGSGNIDHFARTEDLVSLHLTEKSEATAWDALTQDQGTWDETMANIPEEESGDPLTGLI